MHLSLTVPCHINRRCPNYIGGAQCHFIHAIFSDVKATTRIRMGDAGTFISDYWSRSINFHSHSASGWCVHWWWLHPRL